jgi:hypothetical protein
LDAKRRRFCPRTALPRSGHEVDPLRSAVTFAPPAVRRAPGWTERLHTRYEYFGTFSRDKEQDFIRRFFSPGVTYLFNPDFEFGVRIGFGLNAAWLNSSPLVAEFVRIRVGANRDQESRTHNVTLLDGNGRSDEQLFYFLEIAWLPGRSKAGSSGPYGRRMAK